jgi:hypothetical protein
VSIVIPAFNAADTIRDALRSVTEQTFRNCEILVVDDGSQDATADIVTGEFPGIRLLRQPNAGPAAARNRGIAESRGEWLAFLDADDVWFPWKLEWQLQCAGRYPDVNIWCGRTVSFDTKVTPLPEPVALESRWMNRPLMGRVSGPRPGRNTLPGLQNDVSLYALPPEEFAEHNPVATSTVLARTASVREANGFDPRFRGPEDYDLWIRLAAENRMGFADLAMAGYRSRRGSLSTTERTFLPEVLRVLDKAYAPGGGLFGRPGKRWAKGYQMLSASWAAAEDGKTGRAFRLLLNSLLVWPWPYRGRHCRLPWARTKLLVRLVRSRPGRRDRSRGADWEP